MELTVPTVAYMDIKKSIFFDAADKNMPSDAPQNNGLANLDPCLRWEWTNSNSETKDTSRDFGVPLGGCDIKREDEIATNCRTISQTKGENTLAFHMANLKNLNPATNPTPNLTHRPTRIDLMLVLLLLCLGWLAPLVALSTRM
uniref:Uncharacterized protein n=1 Tax=Anopheles farauti TaxID=69004 RepID=A0A182Q0C4_9DIPT